MAEEDTYRKPYGQWLYLEDSPGWECLDEPGEVVEFTTQHVPGHLGSGAIGAYLVRECSRAPDGSMVLKGRCVGCDNEEVGKTLSTLLNRHYLPLHLCWQEPCTLEGGSEVVHVVRARCFQREAFEAPYLKAWGKLVLRGMDGDKKDDGGAAGDGEKPPGTGRKAKDQKPAGGRKKEKRGPPILKRPAGVGGLRGKLRSLREGLKGKAKPIAEEPIEIPDSEEYSPSLSEAMEEALKVEGTRKKKSVAPRPQTTLALVEAKKEDSEETEDGEDRQVKPKKKRKRKAPKDPSAQLLAQAAQRGEVRKEEKRSKMQKGEGKKSGLEKAKALVKLLTGGGSNKATDRSSRRRKSSSAKRRKRKEGESPSGSSGDSSYGEEEESSGSSSEMLAPLQKRSSRQPGAVLKMLVEHAKASLDQSALVETTRSGNVTEG